jgi:hypothetical protein
MLSILLYTSVPLALTCVPLLAGRHARATGCNRARRAVMLVASLLSVGLLLTSFLNGAPEVSRVAALLIDAIAVVLLILFPAWLYAELGFQVRSKLSLVLLWLLLAPPYVVYMLTIGLEAGALLDPGQSPFS